MKKLAILLIGILFTLFIIGCSAQEAIHTTLDDASDDAQVIIRGRTGDDTYQVPRVDAATHSIQVIAYDHHEIHDGNTFTILDVVDLGNMGTRDILLVTPDTTRWAHLVWEVEHELESSINFYRDTLYSDNGTPVLSFNRNGNSTNIASTLVYHTPTITNVGTLVGTIQQGAGKKAGGSDRESNEFILKQDTTYLIRISNLTVNNNLIFTKLNWYEHISRSP